MTFPPILLSEETRRGSFVRLPTEGRTFLRPSKFPDFRPEFAVAAVLISAPDQGWKPSGRDCLRIRFTTAREDARRQHFDDKHSQVLIPGNATSMFCVGATTAQTTMMDRLALLAAGAGVRVKPVSQTVLASNQTSNIDFDHKCRPLKYIRKKLHNEPFGPPRERQIATIQNKAADPLA